MYPVHVHIPFDMLEDHLGMILKLKPDLEIAFGAFCLDRLKREEFSRVVRTLDYSPSVTFHAPFQDLSSGAIDEKIRRISEKRILQVLNLSEYIKPLIVVVHTGYEKWRYGGLYDEFFRNSKRTFKRVIREAERLNIRIAIENVFEEDTYLIRNLIHEVGSEHLGHCFDIGHFNLFGKIPIQKWFEDLGHFIFELHLHDNRGRWDDHLAPGSGIIDFRLLFSLISQLPEKPILTLEAHSKEEMIKGLERIKTFIGAVDQDDGFSM